MDKSFCLVCGSRMGEEPEEVTPSSCGEMRTTDKPAVEEIEKDDSKDKLHLHYFFKVFQVNLEEFEGKKKARRSTEQYLVSFCDNCEKLLQLLWSTKKKIVELEKDLQRSVEETRKKMECSEGAFRTGLIYNSNETYFKIRRRILGDKLVTTPEKRSDGRPRKREKTGIVGTRAKSVASNSNLELEYPHASICVEPELPTSPPEFVPYSKNELPPITEVKEEVESGDDHRNISDDAMELEMFHDSSLHEDEDDSPLNSANSSESVSDSDSDFEPVVETRSSPRKRIKGLNQSSSESIPPKKKAESESKIKIRKRRKQALEKTPVKQLSERVSSFFDIEFERLAEDNNYKCLKCSRTEQKLSIMKNHIIRSHTDLFVCEHCGQHKSSGKSLTGHINEVHRGRKRKPPVKNKACPICGSLYSDITNLEMHISTHYSKKERLELEARGVKLKFQKKRTPSESSEQKKAPPNPRACQCVQCGLFFTTPQILKNHEKKKHPSCQEDIDQTRKMCPHCGKMVVSNYIHRHVKICRSNTELLKQKEQELKCQHCGKGFADEVFLRQHAQRHTADRQAKCDLCPKAFITKGELARHQKRVHQNAEFPCQQCASSFVNYSHLRRHLSQIHGEKISKKKKRRQGGRGESSL